MVHKAHPNSEILQLPHMIECFTYNISTTGDTLYPLDDTLKDLGIVVSPDLSWSPHIAVISKSARSVAAWVLSVFKTRDKEVMLTLYKSLVRSHLENCCPLWHPRKVCDIQLIESVQRTFTSKIKGIAHINYWDRLKSLKIMSLQRRRERYFIIQMWKILNGHCPNDLDIRFTAPNRRGINALVPKLNSVSSQHHQTIYDSSFAVLGPRLWNILPANIKSISGQEQFKNSLTTYLFTFPDKPPVVGYYTPNTNSLLDWNINKTEALQSGRSETMAC